MKRSESIQDRVYLGLRGAIMDLTLAPGSVIRTQELAERMGVSRTPIREAFIRLQRDDLVKILPQRETTVSLIDLARVEQERFVRTSLELSVAAVLADRERLDCLQAMNVLIEKQVLAGLEGRCNDLQIYDNAFHRLLFAEAGQEYGWELIEQSCPHYHRIRLLSLRSHSVAENVVMGHQELLRAFESGQKQRILDVLLAHVQRLDSDEKLLRGMYPDYFAAPEGTSVQ